MNRSEGTLETRKVESMMETVTVAEEEGIATGLAGAMMKRRGGGN